MIAGSIIGYEIVPAIIAGVGAIETMINNRNQNNNNQTGLHVDPNPIYNPFDGSAFEDPLNINSGGGQTNNTSSLPNIPDLIQQNPELINNNGLTYSDEENEQYLDEGNNSLNEVEQYVDNYPELNENGREQIVINQDDSEENDNNNFGQIIDQIMDNLYGDDGRPRFSEEPNPGPNSNPGPDSNPEPKQPDSQPKSKSDEVDKQVPISQQESKKSDEVTNVDITNKTKMKPQKRTDKNPLKVFKLDRHNILAQTLTKKPQLVSKFGFNTRTLQ